jgi:hypothetical protein
MNECERCQYCHGYKSYANRQAKRTAYYCRHPDQQRIKKYFDDHKILKTPGFIGFTKPDAGFPIKNTPKWCPKAAKWDD